MRKPFMGFIYYFDGMDKVAPHAKFFLIDQKLKVKEVDESTRISNGQFVLRSTYQSSTKTDYRYYLHELLDNSGNLVDENKMQYKSQDFRILNEDVWTQPFYTESNHHNTCIRIEAIDRFGEKRVVAIDNYHDEKSIENALNYIILLEKVGVHKAVLELTKALREIEKLRLKRQEDYRKYRELEQKYLKAIGKI